MRFSIKSSATKYSYCLLLIFSLGACGGGGNGGSSNNGNPTPGAGTQPPTETPASATFQDVGTFGNDFFINIENTDKDQQEIFKINIADGSLKKLSGDMKKGGKVAMMLTSPDNKKLAYLADQDRYNKYELYISNADGSQNIKVHTEKSGEIDDFYWSPDSRHILYRWKEKDFDLDNSGFDYYIFDSNSLSSKYHIKEPAMAWQWSKDGKRIAKLIKKSNNSYTIEILKSEDSFSLHKTIKIEGYDLDIILDMQSGFWNDDLTKMLFQTREKFTSSESGIYWVDMIDGSIHEVKIDRNLNNPRWISNTDDIAYWGLSDSKKTIELFMYDTVSTQSVQMTNTLERDRFTIGDVQSISNNGDLFFLGDSPVDSKDELYRSDKDGSVIEDILGDAGIDKELYSYSISPDEKNIFITAYNSNYFLYNIRNHTVQDITNSIPEKDQFTFKAWSSNSEHIIYKNNSGIFTLNISSFVEHKVELTKNSLPNPYCLVTPAHHERPCVKFFDHR